MYQRMSNPLGFEFEMAKTVPGAECRAQLLDDAQLSITELNAQPRESRVALTEGGQTKCEMSNLMESNITDELNTQPHDSQAPVVTSRAISPELPMPEIILGVDPDEALDSQPVPQNLGGTSSELVELAMAGELTGLRELFNGSEYAGDREFVDDTEVLFQPNDAWHGDDPRQSDGSESQAAKIRDVTTAYAAKELDRYIATKGLAHRAIGDKARSPNRPYPVIPTVQQTSLQREDPEGPEDSHGSLYDV